VEDNPGVGARDDPADPYVVLYDEDCGFCKLTVSWLLRFDRRRRLRPMAIQDPAARDLLRDVPESLRLESAHLVAPDGTLYSVGAAAAPLARLLPGGEIPARLFLRFPAETDRAYRWVAGHRTFFGGRLGIRTDRAPRSPAEGEGFEPSRRLDDA
jgi:predicted DCC family thiol-disulfide oxidoreductase YuxK